MLFAETLESVRAEVKEAVAEFFAAAHRNQTHPNDILLPQWGVYVDDQLPGYKPFGPGPSGWKSEEEYTQYELYHNYRKTAVVEKKEFYPAMAGLSELQRSMKTSIQIELMIYLKFWETDRILFKLYQYTQLALGKSFHWQFAIKPNRKAHEIIRTEIRDPLEHVCPKFYALVKRIFISQVRNAAAHSQYYVTDSHVGFTNYDPANHACLTQQCHDWWFEIFHRLILFYNELIAHEAKIDKSAQGRDTLSLGQGIEIRYTDPMKGKEDLVQWTYDHQRETWSWVKS